MPNPLTQRGAGPLPQGFADVLAAFKRTHDPRLPATLAAAREAGWILRPLAQALGISLERVRQIIKKGDGREIDPETLPEIPVASRAGSPIAELTPEVAASYVRMIEDAEAAERERAETALAEQAEREQLAWDEAERVAAERYRNGESSHDLLEQRNMAALEPFPGLNQPWWVMCRYCKRCWIRNSTNPAKCKHLGTGDPNPPESSVLTPARKPSSPPPPSFDGWPLTETAACAFFAWIGIEPGEDRYTLFVRRWIDFPAADDPERMVVSVIEDADEPPFAAVPALLAAEGWHIADGAEWKPRRSLGPWEPPYGGHEIRVSTDWITLYGIGVELMKTPSATPEKAAEGAMKRRGIPEHAHYQDPETGKQWPVYHRALVRAKLGLSGNAAAPEES